MVVFLRSQIAVIKLEMYLTMSKASKEKYKNSSCGNMMEVSSTLYLNTPRETSLLPYADEEN